jgi:hypothetical protein
MAAIERLEPEPLSPSDLPLRLQELPKALTGITGLDEVTGGGPTTLSDALIRLAESQDTLRAIGASEVNAFVVAEDGSHMPTVERSRREFSCPCSLR